MVATIIIFFVLLVACYICSRENIFSPSVLTAGIWFVTLLLYIILPHNLNAIGHEFLIGINLWVILFAVSSLTMQALYFNNPSKKYEPSQLVRDIFFYISLLTLPLLVWTAYKITQVDFEGNWTARLRAAAIGDIDSVDPRETSPFFTIIWTVSYFIELYNMSKKNRGRVLLLFLMYLTYSLISMSKTNFLGVFVSTAYILYMRSKVKFRYIALGTIAMFLFFLVFQGFRNQSKKQDSDVLAKEFVTLYLLTNPPAFETLEPNSSEHWGELTFRTWYAIQNKLGLSDVEPTEMILPFVYIPRGTNTYTTMYPFYRDFGYWGIAFFAILLGLLSGYLFKKSQNGNMFCTILMAFLLPQLIMQFAGEMVFTNLTLNIKRVIVAFIPFVIGKYNLLAKFEQKDAIS